jgi:hypothetical protein
MKDLYADFMASFQAGVSTGGTPRARLKNALVEIGKFARVIRPVAPMMFADVLYGNKEAFAFIKGNFTEHISLIAELAAECRPASAVKEHSVPFIIAALVPVMIFPVFIGGVMERNGVKNVSGLTLEELRGEMFSDAGIEARAEAAVRGIGL